MLLVLRSQFWQQLAGASDITGSGTTEQAAQTNSGRVLWYSPLIHKVTYLGSSLKKLIDSNEPLVVIPSIDGEGGTEQARQRSDGVIEVQFVGDGETEQARQQSNGCAYQIAPISGSGATMQEVGRSAGQAENVDLELEILAAILAAA